MRFLIGDARRAHVSDDLLSGYLDNQVTAAQRARIEEHLHSCATCRANLNSLRQTVQLLRALPQMVVPRAFTLSEVQVGRTSSPAKREAAPALAPWYWGGALRGVAALAAIALVAAMGALWLRQPGLAPSTQVARVAATALPAAAVAPAAPDEATSFAAPAVREPATEAQKAAGAPAPTPSPSPQVASAQAKQPTQAPGPSAPAMAEKAARDSAQPAAAPRPAPSATPIQARPAAPAPGSTPIPAGSPAPRAVATAPAAAPMPTSQPTIAPTAPRPALALAATTASTPPAGAGRGGAGAVGSAPLALPAPLPSASIATAFPQDTGLAYTDGQGLWTIDRQAGLRKIGLAPGASVLLVAPDRTWIAYQVVTASGSEMRTMRWDGSSPRILVSDATLPAVDQSKPGAVRRLAGEFRWVPGTRRVAFTIASDETLPGQPAQARLELWDVEAESGAPRRLFDLTPNSTYAYSPNGTLVGLLRRGGSGQSGSLTVVSADGTRERKVLDFPANAAGYAYDGQLAWLPDGRALWAAVPDKDTASLSATGGTSVSAGITLYRIQAAGGNAEPVRHIEAIDTAWSPDGTQLAYSRPVTNTPDSAARNPARQLVLANAEGMNGQSYATIDGEFRGWSPDSQHFLYTNAEAWYIGTAGQSPRRTGDTASVPDLRWITGQQLVYPAKQPDGVVLALMSLDGRAVGLTPPGIVLAFDVARR